MRPFKTLGKSWAAPEFGDEPKKHLDIQPKVIQTLTTMSRLSAILLFLSLVTSAIAKVWAVGLDALTVYVSRAMRIPMIPSKLVAGGLLLMEVVACCLLLWPGVRRWGCVLAGGLAGGFFVFHAVSAAMGDVEPCPCFGLLLPTAVAGHAGMAVVSAVLMTLAMLSAIAANNQCEQVDVAQPFEKESGHEEDVSPCIVSDSAGIDAGRLGR